MDAISSDPRSAGGKMVRPRQTARTATPYRRPPQNPNWLSRLVLSPTRTIATGAGKVLSSVFGPDSPSSSSSDGDAISEDDMDDVDGNNNDISLQEKAVDWKSETKRVIEQLLVQETFSREECDRLTNIIESRVVDSPVTGGTGDGRLTEIPARIVGSDDLQITAITEAKRWLDEKRLGSNSKSEQEFGMCTLNTTMLPHVAEGEVGSPVDVAKSYMRARPPWASPSINHMKLRSPSPTGIQLFNEETPRSFGGNTVSSSKLNRDFPTTGSWNILEEIRKVRSRATEEMLRTRPSYNIDWAALASDYKKSANLLVSDKAEAVTTQMLHDGMQNEAIPSNLSSSIAERNQDVDGMQTEGMEGTSYGQGPQLSEDAKAVSQSDAAANGSKDIDGTSEHLISSVEGTTEGEEDAGRDGLVVANGFPALGSSLSAEQKRIQISGPAEEDPNPAGLSRDGLIKGAPEKETRVISSEASIEVPVVNENNSGATASQNSSSMHHEGSSQELTGPNSRRSLAGKTSAVTEKQQGRKVSSRYSRRGRGRGK